MHLPLDLEGRTGVPRHFQVIEVLQVEPEFRIGAKIARQAQGGVGRDAAPLAHNLTDAGGGNTQLKRQLVNRQAERLHEVLAQNFSRMDGRH